MFCGARTTQILRMKIMFGFIIVCFAVTKATANTGSYVVTFPDTLLPGVPLRARVTVIGATGTVRITADLRHSQNYSIITSRDILAVNGIPVSVPIQVPEGLPYSQYKISIAGDGGGLNFRNESAISYETNSLFLFLQTDKTRYSAGQEVRYRAILLHTNLLGYKGTSSITIYDGNDNKIEEKEYQNTKDGVITGSLQLGREPVFGKWKIIVHTGIKSLTKTIDVMDYDLPKFIVQIINPTDIKWTATTPLQIGVTAKFTFNADVLGNCTIQIYAKQNTRQFLEYSKEIRGNVDFTIPMAEITGKFSTGDDIIVRALVTDNATALTIVAEKDLTFASDASTYKPQKTLDMKIINPRDTFVPGIPFYSSIFVGYNADEPLGTPGIIQVTPTITTAEVRQCLLNNPPTQWLDVRTTTLQNISVRFDEYGYAALNIPVPAHTDRMSLQLTYGGLTRNYDFPSVFNPTEAHLRLSMNKAHVNVGEKVTILTEATQPLNGEMSYEIYARDILTDTKVNRLMGTDRTSIDLEITGDMVPQVFVIATHVTSTGRLLSDYVMMNVAGHPFKNKVAVTFNATSLEPRGQLRMDIKADPNSTVYLMIEDEKNRLLGTENDIFLNEVENEVLNQKTKSTFLQNNGVVTLTNINMPTPKDPRNYLLMHNTVLPRKCIHITTTTTTTLAPGRLPTPAPGITYSPGKFPTYVPGMVPTPAPGATYAAARIPTPAPGQTYAPWGMVTTPAPAITAKEILRTRFPETWIWEEYQIGVTGKLSVTKTVPDAITAWVSSVFATNPVTGFGISEFKQKIIVKKPFFLTMDLPSSILLGEEILVQISVFSFLATTQQVFLQVVKSDDVSNPIPAATMVKPNEGHSTYVRVTPKQLGTLKINVHAKAGFFSILATDALEKDVLVLPQGVHKTTNEQRLVDVQSNGQPFTETILLKDHPNMVSGTKHIQLKVTGNFMTPTISGLQNLISLPNGCGEQTMVNFAPDVFITKYLNVTGQLTSDVENKALNYIRSGYQHEIGYRHSDGAFSIWGSSDSHGSTWLTAYVMKSFNQAKDLITIDKNVLSSAMTWLLNRQNSDGSFLEQLPVLYVDHRRTGTGVKLSAFTLISILECQATPYVQSSTINSAVTKGRTYLETKLMSITDAYTLSIVCYALAKSGSTFGSSCFSKLESSKHTDGDTTYWTETSVVSRRQTTFNRNNQSSAPARDIETTAYALLTYMALGHNTRAFSIVKWLVSHRNSQGGFVSTQDTVIAIQALTEYAQTHAQKDSSYGVQFNAFGMGFMHSYSTTPKNFDSVHQVEVPTSLNNIIIQAMGNGVAVVDIIQTFYVNSVGNGNYIAVSTTIVKESLNSLTIQATISWTGPANSRMILMDVETPTGFVVDGDFFANQYHVRRHETNGRHVAVYLDEIVQNGQSVVNVKMDRADPVVKNQACHIIVYDYYEPSHQAVTRYESGLLKRANICDVCPLCNFCTGSSGFPQIGVGK